MEKKIGIWLDKRMAKIIDPNGQINEVGSDVEEFNASGGSGSKIKGGPQDVVQDGKYLEREKHQMKAYFNKLAHRISDAHTVVVFGPADTGRKFADELANKDKVLSKKLVGVEKADSMTDNQLRAWVKEYFG